MATAAGASHSMRPSRSEDPALRLRADRGVVRHDHDGVAVGVRPSEAARGSRRPSGYRGCRSARRRAPGSGGSRARARSRRAGARRPRASVGRWRRAMAEADALERRERALAPLARETLAVAERQLDVLDRREPRQQVEALEHEADLSPRSFASPSLSISLDAAAGQPVARRQSGARGSRGSPSASSCPSPRAP